MKKSTIIIIAVIAVVVIGGGVAAAVVLGNAVNSITGENSEITYNYEVKDSISSYDYYTSYDYNEVKASDGMVFAVVKVVMKNNNYNGEYAANTYDFKYVCSNDKTYELNWDASYHYTDTITKLVETDLSKGQSVQYTALIEIPKDTNITGIKYSPSNYTSYKDTNLKIDADVGNHDRGKPSVLYNYVWDKTVDSISTYSAGAGYKYVVYIVTEKNNNDSDGCTPSLGDLKIKTSDGNLHGADSTVSKTYSQTSTAISTTLSVGNSATYYMVFKIAENLTENTSLEWTSSLESGERDRTLPIVV